MNTIILIKLIAAHLTGDFITQRIENRYNWI